MTQAIAVPTDGRAATVDVDDITAAPQTTWRFWWALGLLTIIYLFAFMDRMALAILLQPIKVEQHLSDQQLGLLSGIAFAFIYSIIGIPLARIADRGSRARLIAVCTVLWSFAMVACGFARNFSELFLARMGVGIGEAGCVPPAHSLIGDYFPRERRALAISIYQAGAAAGLTLGMALVGLLGQLYGWRAAMIVVGLAGLPFALLAMFALPDPKTGKASGFEKESASSALKALLRRPAFRHLAVGYSVGSICTYGITQWTPSFLMRSFGMSLVQVGGWTGLVAGSSGIMGLLAGGALSTWFIRRDPRWELWLPALGYGVALPLYLWMFLSPTAFLALLAKFFAYFATGVAGGVAFSAVQTFSEPHRRATAVSLVLFLTTMLGMGVGPYLIGLVSDLLMPALGAESLRYALLVSCAMLAWAIVHFYVASRHYMADRVQ